MPKEGLGRDLLRAPSAPSGGCQIDPERHLVSPVSTGASATQTPPQLDLRMVNMREGIRA